MHDMHIKTSTTTIYHTHVDQKLAFCANNLAFIYADYKNIVAIFIGDRMAC